MAGSKLRFQNLQNYLIFKLNSVVNSVKYAQPTCITMLKKSKIKAMLAGKTKSFDHSKFKDSDLKLNLNFKDKENNKTIGHHDNQDNSHAHVKETIHENASFSNGQITPTQNEYDLNSHSSLNLNYLRKREKSNTSFTNLKKRAEKLKNRVKDFNKVKSSKHNSSATSSGMAARSASAGQASSQTSGGNYELVSLEDTETKDNETTTCNNSHTCDLEGSTFDGSILGPEKLELDNLSTLSKDEISKMEHDIVENLQREDSVYLPELEPELLEVNSRRESLTPAQCINSQPNLLDFVDCDAMPVGTSAHTDQPPVLPKKENNGIYERNNDYVPLKKMGHLPPNFHVYSRTRIDSNQTQKSTKSGKSGQSIKSSTNYSCSIPSTCLTPNTTRQHNMSSSSTQFMHNLTDFSENSSLQCATSKPTSPRSNTTFENTAESFKAEGKNVIPGAGFSAPNQTRTRSQHSNSNSGTSSKISLNDLVTRINNIEDSILLMKNYLDHQLDMVKLECSKGLMYEKEKCYGNFSSGIYGNQQRENLEACNPLLDDSLSFLEMTIKDEFGRF